MRRWLADRLWAAGFKQAATALHWQAAKRAPRRYVLLCTRCSPTSPTVARRTVYTKGLCVQCGRYGWLKARGK